MNPDKIDPPKGHEILTPEFLREHGAQEGMKHYMDGEWFETRGFDVGESLGYVLDRYPYSAPLGTMAMVSTPLPEVVCLCAFYANGAKGEHNIDCPAHPRNARVKVLPGWLAELGGKPEGLEWARSGDGSNWSDGPNCRWFMNDGKYYTSYTDGDFAYSLPRYVYDAIEEGKKVSQSESVGIIPTSPEGQSAQMPQPAIGVEAATQAPTYRPLAPDEVPQVGDEWKEPGEDRWVKTVFDRANPDSFYGTEGREWRTTRHAPKPALKTPCPHCGYENYPQHVLCASCNLAMEPAPVAGTPLFDEVAKAIGSLAAQWKQGDISAQDFAVNAQYQLDRFRSLESALAAANAENERLNRTILETDYRSQVEAEIEQLKARLNRANAERDELAEWKRQALIVESWWLAVDEAVRKHPDCKLGESVSIAAVRIVTESDQLRAERDALRKALEWAWAIIANAGGGDWNKESPEWKAAAEKWRDEEWQPLTTKGGAK